MKEFLKKWAYSYTIVNIIFLVVSFVILRRLNIDVSFLKLSIGAILISLLIASSITVFRAEKLNSVTRTIGGFLFILPIIFITRRLFGVMIFRFSFVIYIFAILCAVIYAIAVIVVTKKTKAEEKSLNELLFKKNNKAEKEEDDEEKEEKDDKADGNFFSIK